MIVYISLLVALFNIRYDSTFTELKRLATTRYVQLGVIDHRTELSCAVRGGLRYVT